jgi:hypothetical protein
MTDQTSSRFDRAAAPVYFLAFLFLALPLMDYVMNVWPLQLDKVNWRYGAFGLAGGFLLTPLLGLVILLLASAFFDSRKVLRITAVLASILSVGLILLTMAFVLDSLQMRSSVPAGQKRVFDVGVAKALIKDLTGAVSAGLVALAALRIAKGPATARRSDGSPIVVGAKAGMS